MFEAFARIFSTHEQFSDQESLKAFLAQFACCGGVRNAAFRDTDGFTGQLFCQKKRMSGIGVEGAQMAVVDTYHIHSFVQIFLFPFVVKLEQYLQLQFLALRARAMQVLRSRADAMSRMASAPQRRAS